MPRAAHQQANLRVVTNRPDSIGRRPVLVGLILVLMFFGLLGGWAGTAKLTSAAIAPGVVSVDGARKTVQHLEGGIVREISVRDGERVTAGQVLVVLEDVGTSTELALVRRQRILASAYEARLVAEQDDLTEAVFPTALTQSKDPEVAREVAEQARIFRARRRKILDQILTQNDRIARLEDRINAIKGQSAAKEKQLRIVRKQLADLRGLFDRGYTSRERVYILEGREAEIEGDISADLAAIAGAGEQIAEIRHDIAKLIASRFDDATRRLREARHTLETLDQKIATLQDKHERTSVRAPVDGIVVNLQVHTLGGVVTSGQAILDIVPSDRRLIIDARLDPKDRDVVVADLPAEVRFSAFSQRSSSPVKGKVIFVSADRMTEARTQQAYYLTRVELTEDPSQALNGAAIHPGMQAEVMIVTGKRTAIDYLLRPLTRSFKRSLTED